MRWSERFGNGCILAGCLSLLCQPLLRGAARSKASEDVTVLLFGTEAVQRLQVRSPAVSFRRCGGCAEQHGPVSMDLRLSGGTMLDGNDKPLQAVELDGEAKVLTDGGHQAEAAGRWRIDADRTRLRVHIEVSRERYVEAVLAAEAAPDEPTESLKALAVTARSFAAAVPQRHPSGMLCDTTHCQALRLEPVPQRVHEAVWDTSGETLWFGEKQVPAYFSQHCGGFTEDASLAWGGPPSPWLTAHADIWCERVPSSWHASMSESEVRRALGLEGFPVEGPIQEIAALNRDRSGRVQLLRLRAADRVRTLRAATLRFALNRSLGWNQLRSDRYQMRRVGDRIIFEGSGFGHGVGLCQAGAAAMARAGKSYREILATYFPGSTVRIRAQDEGWRRVSESGFLLRTTSHNAELEAAAVRAFADARSRWNGPVKVTPTVTVFPSTEAFRQATGQPGWELAATQGDHVSTQPTEVLRAHGGAELVLRHEFLHSFVEAEASPAAPLWLREGLVAVLNGESCPAAPTLSAGEIDAALHHAVSLAQSQQTHVAACALTKRTIAQHGIAVVRAMLQHP